MLNETQYLKHLYTSLRQLTPAARRILIIFLDHDGQWLTRRQLAGILGKNRLMRYDIAMLDRLQRAGFIDAHKQRLMDSLGEQPRRVYRGRDIRLVVEYYSYRLQPGLSQYLNQLRRRR
jgi:hypothetical protein